MVMAEELNVLGNELLYEYLLQESKQKYDERATRVRDALESPRVLARRQKQLLGDYRRIIGELPTEKTPLNAEVTGIIECDGYRIEKVIFESRPNHHVTANLYVPSKGKKPYPGIIMPCGHIANGKAAAVYQSACALLALNGFVVLIYDPISQGERRQLPKSKWYGTTTHCMLNVASLLVGRSIVGYEAWDGIRSIDYLLSRDEVDKTKAIGMTGNSGGGTQTNFLMALDKRIGPAAPSCYVMQKQRKYETIGPGDGCQHLPGEVALGIDHLDYFWMRAPKPTLILAAEQDFFEFKSTQKAAAEALKLYTALAKPERTAMVSYNGKHGFAEPLREAAVSWMKRWLMNDTTPLLYADMTIQTDEALSVTETGQVLNTYKNESTVAAMNLKRARELAVERRNFWEKGDQKSCLAEVKRMIGSREKRGKAKVKKMAIIKRDGYEIETMVIRPEEGIPIPALLFVPGGKKAKRPVTIYVDGRGKLHAASPGGEIEKLVLAGRMVLSIDVAGFGETEDRGSKTKYNNKEHRVANLAMHLGRPLLGQRVDHILTAADMMMARKGSGEMELLGIGNAGPAVLHAGALDQRFASVTVGDSINSWVDDVAAKPLKHDLLGQVVPGALLKYDLPDLLRVIQSRE